MDGIVARTTVVVAILWSTVGCASSSKTPPIRMPGAVVHQDSGCVELNGSFCLKDGILEYLAVADGGKEYESMFALDGRPSHIHMALMIAGGHVGEVAAKERGDFAPGAEVAAEPPPQGAPSVKAPPREYYESAPGNPTRYTIDVDVRAADGSWRRRPVEHFLIDRATEAPPARLQWAFTGSFFQRDDQTGADYFVADFEKSVIALWYDPTALLNVTHSSGNPYRRDVAGLEINPENTPEKGTPARLVLTPVS